MKSSLEIQEWPLDKLIPYAKNPRKNDEVVDKMATAITEFGFRIPIVAKSDGSVIDGHLRLKAAQKLGLKSVPVVLADDLTDAQVRAFRLLANRSANWAEWEMPLLLNELSDLGNAGYDLELTGFNHTEIEDVLNFQDINFSGEKSQGINGKGFGKNQTRVKVVLSAEVTESLEAAIAKTGEMNRAEAVKKICEAYLEKR